MQYFLFKTTHIQLPQSPALIIVHVQNPYPKFIALRIHIDLFPTSKILAHGSASYLKLLGIHELLVIGQL